MLSRHQNTIFVDQDPDCNQGQLLNRLLEKALPLLQAVLVDKKFIHRVVSDGFAVEDSSCNILTRATRFCWNVVCS